MDADDTDFIGLAIVNVTYEISTGLWQYKNSTSYDAEWINITVQNY